MARLYAMSNGIRVVTANDAVPSTAPAGVDGSAPVNPQPAGVFVSDGARMLFVDVSTPGGATGNTTVTLWAWSGALSIWVADTTVVVPVSTAGARAKVLNWASTYCFPQVTLSTGGNPTSVCVLSVLETAS